jgi:hypothetical protein
MKTESKEFQLKITPGSELVCPRCGREDGLSVYDGDTIPMHEAMPDAKAVADGLALSKDGHSFYACLNACVCLSCGAGCHVVVLNIIRDDEVSRDWASAYFWLNGDIAEPFFRCTISCRGGGLPKRCTLEATQTDCGDLERYCFGPFITRRSLEASNGVANCVGVRVWKHAADMIARVWPLIVKHSAWQESITVRSSWPLHEVNGWKPGKRSGRSSAQASQKLANPDVVM